MRRAHCVWTGLAALWVCCVACSVLDDLDDLTSGPIGAAGAEGTDGGAAGVMASGGAAGAGGTTGGAAGSSGAAGASAGSSGAAGAGAAGSSAGSSGAAGAGAAGSSAGSSGTGGTTGTDAGAIGATRIYWLEQGSKTVNVANIDGSQSAPLLTLTGGAASGMSGIAIEPVGAKVYFTDELRQRMQRADLDGAGLLTLIPSIDPVGIDIDPGAGKLYFALRGATPAVQRGNLDGTGLEPLITTGIQHPGGLALDVVAGKIYFVDDNLDAVFSAALDGSNLTNLNIAGVDGPIDISLDPLEGKLYWSELGAPGARIRRANLDGSGVEDIVTTASAPGFSTPRGVEVDVSGRVLYFVDGGQNGAILRAHLDGSVPTPVLLNLNEPTGVTLQ